MCHQTLSSCDWLQSNKLFPVSVLRRGNDGRRGAFWEQRSNGSHEALT